MSTREPTYFRKDFNASRLAGERNVLSNSPKAPKLLLTATPLHNSLLELFSLVSVIDAHVFGDIASFRQQFIHNTDEVTRNLQLKQRIVPVCTRALRKQVTEYIPFTNRIPITQEFLPTDQEQALYDDITAYLQREVLYALPASPSRETEMQPISCLAERI